MITMYKLLSQNMTSHGGMKWKIGKTNKAKGKGTEMCTNQVLHCYHDPRLAIIFNPIHANYSKPRLFKISCSDVIANDGLKYATKEQTPIEELKIPKLSTKQIVAFSIKCALFVYKNSAFVGWAEKWLSGDDQTAYAANAAAHVAYVAARAAAYAAAYAAYAAANAADAAANAADAAYAAYVAANAADAAANAADAAINFVEIIDWVMENID